MTRLEFARRSRGLSQCALAARLGLHPANISAVERGQRKAWPSLAQRLANVLGSTVDELFDMTGWARDLDREAVEQLLGSCKAAREGA